MSGDARERLDTGGRDGSPAIQAMFNQMKEQSTEHLNYKVRMMKYIAWMFLIIDMAGMSAIAVAFYSARDLKYVVMLAALFIICFESTVLIKLWYWVVHTRISLQREMKELQLQIAKALAALERNR